MDEQEDMKIPLFITPSQAESAVSATAHPVNPAAAPIDAAIKKSLNPSKSSSNWDASVDGSNSGRGGRALSPISSAIIGRDGPNPHDGRDGFWCFTCQPPSQFHKSWNLRRHVMGRHLGRAYVYKCFLCGGSFKSSGQRQSHVAQQHPNEFRTFGNRATPNRGGLPKRPAWYKTHHNVRILPKPNNPIGMADSSTESPVSMSTISATFEPDEDDSPMPVDTKAALPPLVEDQHFKGDLITNAGFSQSTSNLLSVEPDKNGSQQVENSRCQNDDSEDDNSDAESLSTNTELCRLRYKNAKLNEKYRTLRSDFEKLQQQITSTKEHENHWRNSLNSARSAVGTLQQQVTQLNRQNVQLRRTLASYESDMAQIHCWLGAMPPALQRFTSTRLPSTDLTKNSRF